GPCGSLIDVYMYALHGREVDQKSTVDRCASGDVVTPATHGDVEVERPCERQRVDDVGNAVTARDNRRMLVDHPVVHPTTLVVPGVVALEQLSGERRENVPDGFGDWLHGCALPNYLSCRVVID